MHLKVVRGFGYRLKSSTFVITFVTATDNEAVTLLYEHILGLQIKSQ